MKNPIMEAFAASVTTRSVHPGYSVLVRDRKGQEAEHGPYSKPIAFLCASEFKCFPFVAIRNEETGEIVIQ